MTRISNLAPSRAQSAIAGLREREGGASLRTCNAYRTAVKSFSRWLVRDGRTVADALVGLDSYNADEDRQYVRRDLDAHELARLVNVAEQGPVVDGMAGADRRCSTVSRLVRDSAPVRCVA